jgi:hypothetical protein
VGTRQVVLRLTRNVSTTIDVVIEADESSTRGRRSNAPAGGSIIMSPRRGRAARQEELAAEEAVEEETVEETGDDVAEPRVPADATELGDGIRQAESGQ